MNKCLVLVALLAVLSACMGQPTPTSAPTPDIQATVDAAVTAERDRLAAEATPTIDVLAVAGTALAPTPTPSLPLIIRLPTVTPTPVVEAAKIAVNDLYDFSVKVPAGWEVDGDEDWFTLSAKTGLDWPFEKATVTIRASPHEEQTLEVHRAKASLVHGIRGYDLKEHPRKASLTPGGMSTGLFYSAKGDTSIVIYGWYRTLFRGDIAIDVLYMAPVGSCCSQYSRESDFIYESLVESLQSR